MSAIIPEAFTTSHTSPVLRVPFNFIGYPEVVGALNHWRASNESGYIVLANPHSVMHCRRDREFRAAVFGGRLILPDGIGIILAARILGYPDCGRVTGPNLMIEVCDRGRSLGFRHFFYGGAPGVASELAHRLQGRFPEMTVAGHYSPPFHPLVPKAEAEVVRMINEAEPDIVWVGLGTGKQEKWMAAHADCVRATALVGVGAAFDFHSANLPWAPAWIRAVGLEWAYRLMREPRRLWRRNLDSPLFLASVLRQRLGTKRPGHGVRVSP